MKIVRNFSINGIAMRLDNDATELKKKELWTIDELEDASRSRLKGLLNTMPSWD